jgi:hypothetical protein
MMLLPVTVLDNFFDDPDQIRNYGLSLATEPDSEGRWPGSRTANLAELNPALFDHVCRRIASLFYDTRDVDEIIQWQAQGGFQLVDSSYRHGWVHHDAGQELFTAIIYLTPDAAPATGTSIYDVKDRSNTPPREVKDAKFAAMTGQLTAQDSERARATLADYYTESIRVSNKYNRIVIFDSHLYHAANEFATNTQDRLTLTIFFSKLASSKHSPVQRLRRTID